MGELGAAGVRMSDAFLAVQRRFAALQRRGALLCLVTRNEESDVREVLRSRRDEMALREEHVVAVRAGWGRKSDHILELAATLCLGLSSFVFVDDSPAECADVVAACAARGVAVVHVPRDEAAIGAHLDAHWALEPPATAAADAAAADAPTPLTEEDAQRTTLYRQLDERKSFAASTAAAAASTDAFVASLNLRVDIAPVDAASAERAAQLTERTNQHNACKWQTTGARLLLACDGCCTCLGAEASDRFGHHGLVGLIVCDEAPSTQTELSDAALPSASDRPHGIGAGPTVLQVRCWLLSCRSLHLGIEHAMLRHAAAIGRLRGASHLGVHWRRAERNEPAAAFLFSLPGVSFVDVHDANALGLGPLEARACSCAAPSAPVPTGAADAPDRAPPAAEAAWAAPPEAAAAVPAPSPTPTGGGGEAEAAAGTGAAADAERALRSAIAAGRRLQLSELPAAEALATLAAPERKMLVKRLTGLASKARGGAFGTTAARSEHVLMIRGRVGGERCRHAVAGEPCAIPGCPFVHERGVGGVASGGDGHRGSPRLLVQLSLRVGSQRPQPHDTGGPWVCAALRARGVPSLACAPAGAAAPTAAAVVTAPPPKQRDLTYGQISQYKKGEARPEAGIILVPIESAEAAQVSLSGLMPATPGQPSAAAGAAAVRGRRDDAPSGEAAAAARPGFESSTGIALHPDTCNQLAGALATAPERLHEWVAAEAARAQPLPDAFREVWDQYERQAAGVRGAEAAGEPLEDVEALHARLRRRLRHSMHIMVQQANPESYYKDVVHPEDF